MNLWLEQEQRQETVLKPELVKLIAATFISREQSELEGAIGYLAFWAVKRQLASNEQEFEQKFLAAHAMAANDSDLAKSDKLEQMKQLFAHMSYGELLVIVKQDHVIIPEEMQFHTKDLMMEHKLLQPEVLQSYLDDNDTQVVIALGDKSSSIAVSPENIDTSKHFPIHSVGKVFTGMLVLKMVEQGYISESDLDKPPKFKPEVTEFIAQHLPTVSTILQECTLKDLMLHTSGLGDYLFNYKQALRAELEQKNSAELASDYADLASHHAELASDHAELASDHMPKIISKVAKPKDFLVYAEDKKFDMDGQDPSSGQAHHYSNLGILLVGLAVEYAYNANQKLADQLAYNELLTKFILVPAGMENFRLDNPGDGMVNPKDPLAKHIVGSPAGGYWVTTADLLNFARWCMAECEQQQFFELVQKHGTEFYSPTRNIISHSGIEESSSAMLRIYLNTGTAVMLLSPEGPLAINFLSKIEDYLYRSELALIESPDSSKKAGGILPKLADHKSHKFDFSQSASIIEDKLDATPEKFSRIKL